MIKELKNINNKLIDLYQNNKEELNKQLLIKEILNEPNCFLKINIETAYKILKDLQIPDENLKIIYERLI